MSCVNVTLGLLNLEETDFAFPGFIPFALVRSYRSNSTFAGMFGYGWGSNLGEEILIKENQVVLRNSEGRTVQLSRPELNKPIDNSVEGIQVSFEIIVEENGNKVAVLKIKRGNIISFYKDFDNSNIYRIYRIEDSHGNAIKLFYKSGVIIRIIDTSERKFTLQYDKLKRLTGVQLEHQGSKISLVEYNYSNRNDLVKVKKYTGATNHYEYQDHLLVHSSDDLGVDYYNVYDKVKRCIRTWRNDNFLPCASP